MGLTYQGATAGGEDGLVSWGTVGDLVWAVGGCLAAEVEFLAGGVQLEVVDWRGGADGHDAEVGVGGWLAGWGGGGQEGEGEGCCELHGLVFDVGCWILDMRI